MAVSVKIDDDMRERIQTLAESKQRSAHWVMREAIREYVDREEARAVFNRDTEDAWRHFQETGHHLTGKEVFAWMDSWGSDEESGPPPCHS